MTVDLCTGFFGLLALFVPVLVLVAIGVIAIMVFAQFFIRVVFQFQKAIVFTLGKYTKTAGPGLLVVIPILQRAQVVDMRIKTIDIPKQEVMSKDNVPIGVNAVLYFRVIKPEYAIIKIEDYSYAVSQYAQTALRDIIGNSELDTILTQREHISEEIKKLVDEETEEWGVDVTAIKIQDIELPADMKRAMARQAEAEREKRATIIMSGGEKIAAENLSKAADKLSKSPGALHLRTLQTLSDISPDKSKTNIYIVPVELFNAVKKMAGEK